MKKVLFVFAVTAILAACGTSTSEVTSTDSTAVSADTTVVVDSTVVVADSVAN